MTQQCWQLLPPVQGTGVLLPEELETLLRCLNAESLATDQRFILERVLVGRSLTGVQAGQLLGAVRLGIMQRVVARDLLRNCITDLPDSMPRVLGQLEEPLRSSIEADLRDDQNAVMRCATLPASVYASRPLCISPAPALAASATVPASAASGGGTLPQQRADWTACMERLRSRVLLSEEISDGMYQDLADAFDSLGLAPLPAASSRASTALAAHTAAEPSWLADAEETVTAAEPGTLDDPKAAPPAAAASRQDTASHQRPPATQRVAASTTQGHQSQTPPPRAVAAESAVSEQSC